MIMKQANIALWKWIIKMKKICLILAVLLATAESSQAANFVDTVGAECGKMLFNMNNQTYPKLYSDIVKRNTQFDALERCLDLYKKNGGNIKELNARYFIAESFYGCVFVECTKRKKNPDAICERDASFNVIIEKGGCWAYGALKDIYPNCDIWTLLKAECEQN